MMDHFYIESPEFQKPIIDVKALQKLKTIIIQNTLKIKFTTFAKPLLQPTQFHLKYLPVSKKLIIIYTSSIPNPKKILLLYLKMMIL